MVKNSDKKSTNNASQPIPSSNIQISQLPTVTIGHDVDWWYSIPVFKNVVIDCVRPIFRRCRLMDAAGNYTSDPGWSGWIAKFKKLRSKWTIVSSQLRIEFRIIIDSEDLKKYAGLITNLLFSEIQNLDASSHELSRYPSLDVARHRKSLAEFFPELAVEMPASKITETAPVIDMSPISALLEQILSVNQTMLATHVDQSKVESSLLPLSKLPVIPSINQSSTKSDKSVTHSKATKQTDAQDAKTGAEKLVQAIKFLGNKPVNHESTARRIPPPSSSFCPPSIDIQHQINRKKVDLEAGGSNSTKKRKKPAKSSGRNVRARSNVASSAAARQVAHSDDEVSEDDEVDPDQQMGDAFSEETDSDANYVSE